MVNAAQAPRANSANSVKRGANGTNDTNGIGSAVLRLQTMPAPNFSGFSIWPRLVGEGDGGDAARLDPGLDQPRDLVRDDPRLAGARPGEHQARAAQVVDGILLGEVEAVGHARRR